MGMDHHFVTDSFHRIFCESQFADGVQYPVELVYMDPDGGGGTLNRAFFFFCGVTVCCRG